MKKILALLFSIIISFSAFGEVPSDSIKGELNVKYLEYLIKSGIDSVRESNGLTALSNDSILYVSSRHHSKYQLKKRQISHVERGPKKYRDPQTRVEFFGGKDYYVGENVQVIPYNVLVKNKTRKSIETYSTYQELAYAFVEGWVNSKGHFKNVISKDYQLTAVAVTYDRKTNNVYATQTFSNRPREYISTSTSDLFPKY